MNRFMNRLQTIATWVRTWVMSSHALCTETKQMPWVMMYSCQSHDPDPDPKNVNEKSKRKIRGDQMSTEREETPSVLIDPKSVEAMQAGDADGMPQIKVFLTSGSTIVLSFASKAMRDQAMHSFSNLFIGHIVL